jgi:hypothetical protein
VVCRTMLSQIISNLAPRLEDLWRLSHRAITHSWERRTRVYHWFVPEATKSSQDKKMLVTSLSYSVAWNIA